MKFHLFEIADLQGWTSLIPRLYSRAIRAPWELHRISFADLNQLDLATSPSGHATMHMAGSQTGNFPSQGNATLRHVHSTAGFPTLDITPPYGPH